MPDRPTTAVPRDFLCEHTSAKSRVLALVGHPDGPASLQAVLTCRQPELAHRAAQLLRGALHSTPATWRAQPLELLCAQLPDAPASSVRGAVAHLLAGTWPVTEGSLIPWPDSLTDAEDEEEDPQDHGSARTPDDARLADLSGPVVRIAILREYHVHDEEALLRSAAASGWTPLPSGELDGQDPKDIVGAVMALADDGVDLAGADTISDQSTAGFLRSENGHELADWSTKPVSLHFGTGWRAATSAERTEADGERPDFAALFPVGEPHCEDPECEEDACQWQLTPRTADLLHTALSVLADQAYDDADELGDQPISRQEAQEGWGFFTRLPKLTYTADLQWRRRMARAADDLAGDLEAGHWPEPTCTAEELTLHLALGEAPDYADETTDDPEADHHALPEHKDDYDFDTCKDVLFQDHDVLMLYSARHDGIEDPDDDTNQTLGIGDLRPAAWFHPFQNETARDPHRGFRR
ncbi:hypothetical protein GCM10020229_75940 [Kitasatospora albolonga]|uniref:hypothetical protein n=1 Tax=Kitasatospora albolonga TaxID=68173 RepID=UPI0031E9315F